VRRSFRVAFHGLTGLLLFVLPAVGQVQIGDLSSNLNGIISAGYAADYGNDIESSHGLNLGGSATASGYYYNPNFISYNLSPYYGQSRANSNYQSISDSSGVNLSTAIFSGSHFPGQVSYAAAYNSEGQFAVPGLPNYTTHGNSDTFGINWSAFLPGLPSLTASFQRGSNQYSIYGDNSSGNSDFHSFSLSSAYSIAGFNLGASYNTGVSNSLVPEVFLGEQTGTINTDNSGFGVNVSHSLPLNGNFSTSFYRSDINTDYLGYTYKGDFDTVVATAAVQPTQKLHLSTSASYTDNLAGELFQSVITSGGALSSGNNLSSGSSVSSGSAASSSSTLLPTSNLDSSHAWDFNAAASYSLAANLQLQGQVDRREQAYLGENFGATSYSAGVTYAHGLLGGTFNTALSVLDTMVDGSSQNGLGFSTNAIYTRRIGHWFVASSFNYSQNVSTALITYMASYYGYSANVRRRWGSFNWNASANLNHSGLTNQPGTLSSGQGYSTSFGYGRWINLTGNYAKADGIGLISGGGIVPVNLPPILPENLITLYGGTSYGFGVSSSPMRRLSLTASYSKATSNTSNAGVASANQFEGKNALIQYQFRKMYFTAGYAQLQQGFSVSGIAPSNVSSYYFGVSRWFNFF
jgi:hypothetical protein